MRSHGTCAEAFDALATRKSPPPLTPDRIVLKREQANEILELLKFEGFGVEGEELI